jgi:LmbE family N-acetylglucosaminyl deacetylase
VKPGEPGHDPEQVVVMRQKELEVSCAVLGVSRLELLGYPDSGMMGWSTNDVPGSFWTTPVEEAATRLGELIERHRPDVIVTYDENGFYGHPDHIQVNRVTMAAVAVSSSPAKVYYTTAPRSALQRFRDTMREYGVDWDEPDPASSDPQPEMGVPDEQITTWVDISAYGRQKFEALEAHASQSENIFFLRMGAARFTELMGTETFVRVRDHTHAAVPEDDLFAGLR